VALLQHVERATAGGEHQQEQERRDDRQPPPAARAPPRGLEEERRGRPAGPDEDRAAAWAASEHPLGVAVACRSWTSPPRRSASSAASSTNQSTSREPVVDYDDETLREALNRLYRRRFARLASTSGRATKYRHLLDDALGLPPGELAVLTVLMLRGTQTPGELRQRTDRMHRFDDAASVQAALDGLVERELAARLPRRPGQKEERYAHRLGEDAPAATVVEPPAAPEPAAWSPAPSAPARSAPAATADDDERLARIEHDIAELRSELASLREALGD
jgi:uncharacterized protein YceH (UPF0502 family)